MDKFLPKGFNDFWGQILDYFKEYNKPQEKSLFGRSKTLDLKKLFTCFEKILPNCPYECINPSVIQTIDTVFGMVFHPESPDEYRMMAIPHFFRIIEIIKPEEFSIMNQSLLFFVPFINAARSNDERELFSNLSFSGTGPLAVFEGLPKSSNIPSLLRQLFDFMLSQWERRGFQFCQFFYRKLFLILYRQKAQELSFPLLNFGFSHTVPWEIHSEVIRFISKIVSNGLDIANLIDNQEYASMLLAILQHSSVEQHKVQSQDTFFILTHLVSNPVSVETISGYSILMFKEMAKCASSILIPILESKDSIASIRGSEEIIEASTKFFVSFFASSKNPNSLDLKPICEELLNYSNSQLYCAFIFHSFIRHCLDSMDQKPEIWQYINSLASKSRAIAAMASKIAQYLAIISFIPLFRIDKTSIVDNCKDAVHRSQRNKIFTQYDFLSENIEIILEKPSEFVRKKMHNCWDSHKEINQELSLIPFAPLDSHDLPFESIQVITDLFLSAFTDFNTGSDLESQRNLFSITYSYACTIQFLSIMPPGESHSKVYPFLSVARILFNGCLLTTDMSIRISSFKVLSGMINVRDLKDHMTNSILSHWYITLSLCLVSNDSSLIDIAFDEAVKTIRIGFEGSSSLVPILLSSIEEFIVTPSESIVSFLSSVALFRTDHYFLSEIAKYAQLYVSSNPSFYIQMADRILSNSDQNMMNRLYYLVDNLYSKSLYSSVDSSKNVDWTIVLPIVYSLILDEITQDTPNSSTIIKYLQCFKEPIRHKIIESLDIIHSISTISNEIISIIGLSYAEFVDSVVSINSFPSMKDNPEFVFAYCRTMTGLVIQSYKALKNHRAVFEFCVFLKGMTDSKEIESKIIDLARNSIDMISVYYGAFPYHYSSFFPSATCSTPFDFSSLILPNDVIVNPITTEKGAELSIQTNIGQFVWNFSSISNELYPNDQTPSLNLPSSRVLSSTIEPAGNVAFQQKMNSVFDGIVNGYDSYFNDSNGLDKIPDDPSITDFNVCEINNKYKELMKINEIVEIPKLRPLITCDKPEPSIITSIGLVDPSKPIQCKRVQKNDKATSLQNKAKVLNHRNHIKAALLYVPPNAWSQGKVLSVPIESCSSRFNEFMDSLGWPILLKNHPCYSGGLDVNDDRNGRSSVYVSGFDYEIMFHVAPLMPTDTKDEQQVNKKKHIGNDHIQIVYCESDTEYHHLLVTSQFNHLTIIIYPLPNCLYRIEIRHKDGLKWFGPMNTSMILTKYSMPIMIRNTICNAMTSFWNSQIQFSHPTFDISKKVRQIIDEFAEDDKNVYGPIQCLIQPKNKQ